MSQYILDTDNVSLILCNNSNVIANASLYPITITIITVQELFNGWITKINHPSAIHNLPFLYSKLWTTVTYLQSIEILDFTLEADESLKGLLKKNPSLRKNRLQKDMRIAAIALSLNATIVSRNHRDFSLVPNLKLMNWS